MAATVDGAGAVFRVLGEAPLFQVFQRLGVYSFDVTPDGQRFHVSALGGEADRPLVLVTHWDAEHDD